MAGRQAPRSDRRPAPAARHSGGPSDGARPHQGDCKKRRLVPIGQQHPRPLDPVRRLGRERAIALNAATSASLSPNSIACRHAAMTLSSLPNQTARLRAISAKGNPRHMIGNSPPRRPGTCRFPASGSSRESFADGEVVTIAIDHRATQSLTGEATDPPTGAAIHCHYVDRAAGYLSLALFPAMALSTRRPPSLVRVPASPVPRCRRYYEGATTSHPRIGGRLFASLPPSTASSWFVFAAALPRGRRCLPSQGLLVPVAHSPGARPWTRMDLSGLQAIHPCALAAFLDPGRADVASPWRPHRCCPRDPDGEGLGIG